MCCLFDFTYYLLSIEIPKRGIHVVRIIGLEVFIKVLFIVELQVFIKVLVKIGLEVFIRVLFIVGLQVLIKVLVKIGIGLEVLINVIVPILCPKRVPSTIPEVIRSESFISLGHRIFYLYNTLRLGLGFPKPNLNQEFIH
uniref:hypothetical protein n=1 Tax=Drosera capensis TaxID=4366 RepID=UPI002411933D|nr:hypothetical protein P8577_pgp102 [Drosera capensis]WEQ03421.1 hypothetical protein [Drosera capensis]